MGVLFFIPGKIHPVRWICAIIFIENSNLV